MKTIPIILTSLSVAGALGVTSLAGDLSVQGAAAIAGLPEVETMERTVLGGDENGILMANYSDPRFAVTEIKPEEGVMTAKVEVKDLAQMPMGWGYATYDYEKITEAEADAAWIKIAGSEMTEPEWAELFQRFYALNGVGYAEGSYDYTSFISTWDKVDAGETVSVTDVLYYWVQLGATESDKRELLIGKVDFRNCRHAEGYAGVCTATVDEETGVAVFSADGLGEVREVMSWPEEWGILTRQKYGKFEEKVKDWLEKGELTEGEKAEFDSEVAAIKRALEGSTGVEDVAEALAKLEKLVLGQTDEEQKPVTGTTGKPNGGSVNVGGAEIGGQEGTAEPGKDKSETGEEAKESEATNGGVAGVSANWEVLGGLGVDDDAENEAEGLWPGDSGELEKREEADARERIEGDEGVRGEVEVPELGGAKQGWKGWPWLILVLSVTGVGSWWMWRAFGKRNRR